VRPGLFDYASRRKLPALQADLAALGRVPVRLAVDLPVLESVSALIGVLYTIEGSAQGGQHIAPLLRQHAGANLPTAFFDDYGTLSSRRWDEFLQFADAACPQQEWESAAGAAAATFEAIQAHLDACHGQLAAHA
jgi:heme oxygenase (biliverdin-IX-beta and delta-forming)